MKQRKLKSYVLPTIYVLLLMLVFGTVSLVSTLLNDNPSYLYSIGILNRESTPVVETNKELTLVGKPFTSEKVVVDKYFYDVKADEEKQTNSLIYFQNTYMKNTGVLYKCEETFDAIALMDGVVANVKEDDILGKSVEIEHTTSLRTVYYGLSSTNLKVGDSITRGEIIGSSGKSRISEASNGLLIEVYYNGSLINPEDFYTMNVEDL